MKREEHIPATVYVTTCPIITTTTTTTNTDPNNKNKPKKASIEDTYGISNLKQAGVVIVTLAQELDGALSTIQTLTRTCGDGSYECDTRAG